MAWNWARKTIWSSHMPSVNCWRACASSCAVTTQSEVAETSRFAIADLTLDLIKHKVSRAGERIDLTPKEFSLLSLLMRRAGEVQSRTVIADQVWDMNFESDTNVVEVAIRRLRTKIDDPFPLKLLHTVRGVGYVLEIRD